MNPCKVIDCNKWTSLGEYCINHLTLETPSATVKSRKKNSTVLVTPQESRGLAVFAPGGKNRSFNRKHVRRNGPVSYHTGFSLDMMKDMDSGRISTRHIVTEPVVQEIEHKSLISTLPAIGNVE